MYRGLLALIILCLYLSGNSQSDSIKKQIGYFKFVYENDVFAQTDKYYTQGIFIEYADHSIEKIPLNYLLLEAKGWEVAENKISIRQKCFTPTSISNPEVIIGDRPYAGTIEIEQRKEIYKLKNKVTSAITIGIMGPCAMCEEEQKFIHKITNNAEPKGWRHQISNAPIFNYQLNYSYLLVDSKYFRNDIFLESDVGTFLNNLNAGVNIDLGKGFYYNRKINKLKQSVTKFKIYITSQQSVSYVLYNSLLQGSFLNKSSYSLNNNELEKFVLRNSVNINLGYNKLLLSFACTFISKEIKQGTNHAWGKIGLTILK
jgi:hypothetical protein